MRALTVWTFLSLGPPFDLRLEVSELIGVGWDGCEDGINLDARPSE
jgi:hypothetical protein